MIPWLVGLALAHPFGSKLTAHQVRVELGASEVRLQYRADVPNPLVASATRRSDADPIEEMALELNDGLVFLVNGQRRSLTAFGDWESTPNDDATTFQWDYRLPLEPGTHEVELSNGNLPDVLSVHSAEVWVGPAWTASACSLWRFHDGELVLDEHGRWRATEKGRTVSVAVRPAALWERVTRPSDAVRASQAHPASAAIGPVLGGAALALLALVGLWRQLRNSQESRS